MCLPSTAGGMSQEYLVLQTLPAYANSLLPGDELLFVLDSSFSLSMLSLEREQVVALCRVDS